MPYSAEISRASPTCFIFMLDQSGSMGDPIAGANKSKAQALTDVVNRILKELTLKCAKAEGVRDYFHVALVGYGNSVGSAFSGALAGRGLVPISEVAASPARLEDRTKKVDDGAGGLIDQTIKFPIWVDPKADGGTPMTQAFRHVEGMLQTWIGKYPTSFPPIVINITDGEATDGSPAGAAQTVQSMNTGDGGVLLLNVHISAKGGASVEFPDNDASLPDEFAAALFRMSSILPDKMRKIAESEGIRVSENTRGFSYNADLAGMVKFLDIGTRVGNLR